MTAEQLDEIETLAEAATPGPWVLTTDWSIVQTNHVTRDVWTIPRSHSDLQYIVAMRDHALPLVKALREAREERDEALKDAKTQGAMHHRYYWSLMACDEARAFDKDDHQKVVVTLTKERDEARAEAARWKEHLRHIAYEHCDSPVHYAMNQLED